MKLDRWKEKTDVTILIRYKIFLPIESPKGSSACPAPSSSESITIITSSAILIRPQQRCLSHTDLLPDQDQLSFPQAQRTLSIRCLAFVRRLTEIAPAAGTKSPSNLGKFTKYREEPTMVSSFPQLWYFNADAPSTNDKSPLNVPDVAVKRVLSLYPIQVL